MCAQATDKSLSIFSIVITKSSELLSPTYWCNLSCTLWIFVSFMGLLLVISNIVVLVKSILGSGSVINAFEFISMFEFNTNGCVSALIGDTISHIRFELEAS